MRISNASIIPIPVPNDNETDATYTRRIMGVALLHLYVSDPISDYKQHFREILAYIESISPHDTPLQRELMRLMPTGKDCHLYYGNNYVSLHRSPTGLFKLKHRKIRKSKETHRDGVRVSWPQLTLVPEPTTMAGITPHLERVFAGTSSLAKFVEETSTCYETRRQMSHSMLVSQWFGSSIKTLSLYHSPKGCTSFTPDTSTGDGYSVPFTFVPKTTRLSIITPVSRPVIHYASVPPQLGFPGYPYHRIIAPILRDPEIVEPRQRILRELLLAQILPFIGMMHPEGRASYVGLHYERPSEERPNGWLHTAIYAKHRMKNNTLPNLAFTNDRAAPNMAFIVLLKRILVDTTDPIMYEYRRNYLDNYILKMTFKYDSWAQFFADCNVPCSEDEQLIIEAPYATAEEEE